MQSVGMSEFKNNSSLALSNEVSILRKKFAWPTYSDFSTGLQENIKKDGGGTSSSQLTGFPSSQAGTLMRVEVFFDDVVTHFAG